MKKVVLRLAFIAFVLSTLGLLWNCNGGTTNDAEAKNISRHFKVIETLEHQRSYTTTLYGLTLPTGDKKYVMISTSYNGCTTTLIQ